MLQSKTADHAVDPLIWPSSSDFSPEELLSSRKEFFARCRSLANLDPVLHYQRGGTLEVIVDDAEQERLAGEVLHGMRVRFHRVH